MRTAGGEGSPFHRYASRCRRVSCIAVFASLLLLVSCSARQVIMLDEDGSGEIEVEIVISPPFAAYISDLGLSYGADEAAPIFDLAAIAASLAEEPGLELLEASTPRREELYLLIAFDSIERVLAVRSSGVRSAIRFERTEAFRRVAATIDRIVIEEMLALAAIDPFVSESLLPPDEEMDATEYRDYLSWALEEYQQDRPLDRVFRDARVETRVTPAGTIVQIRGGQRVGDTVLFETPVVEAITNERPIEYSIVFQP